MLRVMIVDDDTFQLELLERALSHEGFGVRCVSTVAGLKAEGGAFSPDVVLVDMNLPDAPNKVSIAAAREVAPYARVVIYSAWDEARLRVLCAQLGADGYVSKSTSVLEIGKLLTAISGG